MYFEQKGRANTQKTLELAVKRGKELGLRHFVVASNTGEVAGKLADLGVDITCVTLHTGFRRPGIQEMAPEVREALQKRGVRFLTTTHLFGGIDRCVEYKCGDPAPASILAHTLRMLGQGVKVCVEISVMALDAGLIPFGEDIVAISGTMRGADTALVIRPAHAQEIFSCQVREIICKPR